MTGADPNAFHDFEHQGWERAAFLYGPGFGPVTVQSVDALLNSVCGEAEGRSGLRLLDVACGPGYVAGSAAARGCSVVGIDFAESMIAVAREQWPGLEFRAGDAESLDFPSHSFDAVAMNFGMLHLARPDDAIAQAFRVLRPGGRYAFTVWDTPPRTAAFEIVLAAVKLHGTMNVPLPEGPPFFRFSDPAECDRSLRAAGFTKVQSVVIPQAWKVESGAALYETMRTSAVRTAALLNMQSAEAQRRIQQEISERVEMFRRDGAIELPMPAILTSAVT